MKKMVTALRSPDPFVLLLLIQPCWHHSLFMRRVTIQTYSTLICCLVLQPWLCWLAFQTSSQSNSSMRLCETPHIKRLKSFFEASGLMFAKSPALLSLSFNLCILVAASFELELVGLKMTWQCSFSPSVPIVLEHFEIRWRLASGVSVVYSLGTSPSSMRCQRH